MKSPCLSVFLVALMVCGLVFSVEQFVSAQNITNVSGIIESDTTWTKNNSPYTLTGPLGVNSGVTLTIEPGVTVNIGAHYIQVSGILKAQGSNNDNIIFSSSSPVYGNIAFTTTSIGWNEQTKSGSIIENCILESTSISMKVSTKINNNTINTGTSATLNVDGGEPTISNNFIRGDIGVHDSSPKIDNNMIIGGINVGNSFIGPSTKLIMSDNIIKDGRDNGIGIELTSMYSVQVVGNVIYDCKIGICVYEIRQGVVIEKNLIINNYEGINYYSFYRNPIIQYNTITKNTVGINLPSSTTIIYNNIYDNSQNNIYLRDNRDSSSINATWNWWGTTEPQVIDLTIHDSKNDATLATVNFTPFLTAPNNQAPATNFMPIPTSTSTPTPAQSSLNQSPPTTSYPSISTTSADQNDNQLVLRTDLQIIIVLLLIVIIMLSIIIAMLAIRKRR